MPLDVQPLSLTRRILMVVLMLGLLGGSLALAQWLVDRHPAVSLPSHADVTFGQPDGVTGEFSSNVSPDEPLKSAARGKQRVFAFDYLVEGPVPLPIWAADLLDEVRPDAGLTLTTPNPVTRLGGVPAFECLKQVTTGTESAFAIIRVAEPPGHMVAFCLSGPGQITDADRQFFDDYCSQMIVIKTEKPSRNR